MAPYKDTRQKTHLAPRGAFQSEDAGVFWGGVRKVETEKKKDKGRRWAQETCHTLGHSDTQAYTHTQTRTNTKQTRPQTQKHTPVKATRTCVCPSKSLVRDMMWSRGQRFSQLKLDDDFPSRQNSNERNGRKIKQWWYPSMWGIYPPLTGCGSGSQSQVSADLVESHVSKSLNGSAWESETMKSFHVPHFNSSSVDCKKMAWLYSFSFQMVACVSHHTTDGAKQEAKKIPMSTMRTMTKKSRRKRDTLQGCETC